MHVLPWEYSTLFICNSVHIYICGDSCCSWALDVFFPSDKVPLWEAVCDPRDVLKSNLPQSVSSHMLSIADYQCFAIRNPDLEILEAQLEDCITAEADEIKKTKKMVRTVVCKSATLGTL